MFNLMYNCIVVTTRKHLYTFNVPYHSFDPERALRGVSYCSMNDLSSTTFPALEISYHLKVVDETNQNFKVNWKV